MSLTFFVLLPSLLIFLFILYVLGREDFVLIRKNVFLEQLFNIAFGSLAVGLFFARLIYVLSHPNSLYLNPLAFLVFPYYPGLSLIGGIIGGAVFVLYIVQSAKFPLGRLFDFMTMSLLGAVAFGHFFSLPFIDFKYMYIQLLLGVVYMAVFVLFVKGLYGRLMKGQIMDGTIALMGTSIFSFLIVLNALLKNNDGIFLFLGSEEIIALVLLFISLVLLIKQELLPERIKK